MCIGYSFIVYNINLYPIHYTLITDSTRRESGAPTCDDKLTGMFPAPVPWLLAPAELKAEPPRTLWSHWEGNQLPVLPGLKNGGNNEPLS